MKKTLRLVLVVVVLVVVLLVLVQEEEEEDLGGVRGGAEECDQIHHIHV